MSKIKYGDIRLYAEYIKIFPHLRQVYGCFFKTVVCNTALKVIF